MFSAVAASSARSAWAVGDLRDKHGNVKQAVIEHWDGRAWTLVHSPDAKHISLTGVAAVSACSAWAAGMVSQQTGRTASAGGVIEHWDGTAWKQVPSAASPRSQALSDVTASSARSAWAVGGTSAGRGAGLILHWNGTHWR